MADDKPPRDLRSLAKAVGQFRSDLDGEAAKVFDVMDAARVRSADVFKKTQTTIAAHAKSIEDIDKLVADLNRANDVPSSDDSSKGSTGSSDATKEPHASWVGGNK